MLLKSCQKWKCSGGRYAQQGEQIETIIKFALSLPVQCWSFWWLLCSSDLNRTSSYEGSIYISWLVLHWACWELWLQHCSCTVTDLVWITPDLGNNGQCRASFPAQGLKPWNNDVQRHIHRCPHLLPNLNLKPWFYKDFKEASIQRGKYRGRH